MTTEITYQHFCNLGALCNPGCFTQYDQRAGRSRYYYSGLLAEACWMGYRKRSPGIPTP